jgi:hypothetical protein
VKELDQRPGLLLISLISIFIFLKGIIMSTNFEINDELTVIGTGNINDPITLKKHLFELYSCERNPYMHTQLILQIFHANLKYFDLRRALLIDPDLRRPIYLLKFDDPDKSSTFINKHIDHALAYQHSHLIKVNGEITFSDMNTYARDVYRLRSFIAWLEYISTGQIQSNYVQDCVVEEVCGGKGIMVPDISFDDLINCLKGEKDLVSNNEPIDLNDVVEIDGIKMDADKITEYLIRKAMLERSDTNIMN